MDNRQGFRFPFQDAFQHFLINPVTSWARFFNPQFFITYNGGDVEVENHVLSQVGSYGKQIGQMQDVLAVLVARLPPEDLTSQERRVVEDFEELTRRVKVAVAAYRPGKDDEITMADVDRVIDGLRTLEHTDPDGYRQLTDRLRRALAADHGVE